MNIELHLIQNFAPSCLNRDDTNAPKDCEFGGWRRARISSQCLKRATRRHPLFAETVQTEVGVRTARLKLALRERLAAAQMEDSQLDGLLGALISGRYAQMYSKDPSLTSVALYLHPQEIEGVADYLLEHWEVLSSADWSQLAAEPKSADEEETSPRSRSSRKKSNKPAELDRILADLEERFADRWATPDIALFGRMMAEAPARNIDAACQVAHTISTNRVTMEMDFFTAVDDLRPQAEPGAAMMGTVGFNSSCFYRYSLISWRQLVDNLKGDSDLAARTVEAFIRASQAAIPTGKQTSMAAQNLPSFVLSVVRRNGCPCSLANAFVRPTRPTQEDDLVRGSIKALDEYWGRVTAAYGSDGIAARPVLCLEPNALSNLAEQQVGSFEDLVTTTMAAVRGEVSG